MNMSRQLLTFSIAIALFGLSEVKAQKPTEADSNAEASSSQQVVDDSQLEFHLFQNFYTQPGASQSTAAMYTAPHPVPYWVGHSYYTYQPLYPHQHLYPHKKDYYSYYAPPEAFYPDCGTHPRNYGALNRTRVVWQYGQNHMGYFPFSSGVAQRIGYAIHSRWYCLDSYGPGGCGPGGCR